MCVCASEGSPLCLTFFSAVVTGKVQQGELPVLLVDVVHALVSFVSIFYNFQPSKLLAWREVFLN